MMRPTVPWMREKYDEFNKLLFNGELGPCEFKVFTTGKGSHGNRLGYFSLTGVSGVFISKSTRQMYRPLPNGQRLYVDEGNFAELCKPVIGMNGNYMATEEALCATLVHEMCHYYVYMNCIQFKILENYFRISIYLYTDK